MIQSWLKSSFAFKKGSLLRGQLRWFTQRRSPINVGGPVNMALCICSVFTCCRVHTSQYAAL